MATTIFDDELTLPGVITQIVPDYLAGYDTSEWGTTESVTIIGTAFNGPVGKPIPIYSPEQAKYIFGDSFDPTTQREASLVAEVYDAWHRGCRTIYAIRISGKEMYKDYELATESELKLRVSGYFPHNENKSCFITYQATQGDSAFGENEGIIRVYKPAKRTVISEKIAGVVDNTNSILVAEINLDSNGFSKSSRLCDVIDLINNLETNNVLTLSLVDENGVPRTNATKEVQEISVGSLFPGIYTLCRDEATDKVNVLTDIQIVRNSNTPLYRDCKETLWKKLVINTDPSKPYPIGAESLSHLKELLPQSLNVDGKYNFLKKVGAIDSIAIKNTTDYEEINLSGFELYNRLGCGYARAAVLKEVSQEGAPIKKYKVVPAPDGDERKVQGIEDGIYSVLQMHESDYIVLAAATAETKLTGKLPKRTEFLRDTAGTIEFADEASAKLIRANCKIDKKDVKSPRVKYNFEIKGATQDLTQESIMAALSEVKVARLPLVKANSVLTDVTKNQLALLEGETSSKICKYDEKTATFKPVESLVYQYVISEGIGGLVIYKGAEDGTFTKLEGEITDTVLFPGGATITYVVGLYADQANVYSVDNAGAVKPVMSLQHLSDEVLNESDYVCVFIEKDIPILDADNPNQTYISVYSNMLEYCSVGEFIDELNESTLLSNKFEFEFVTIETSINDFTSQLLTGQGFNKLEAPEYDPTISIPYTTTDNFARHLAQHCLYTSLKTYPTHGVIGCDKLTGISLNTIATRIEEICTMDLDMYAKKTNGNNMLDSKNAPHPIGRCLSVTFMQYPVTTGNGYNYVSAGAAGYAGMISTLDPDRSSTNQPINIGSLMFTLSNYQLTKLNTAGVVCCREGANGIVVVDGITQAPATSAYRRLSTTKIINAVGRILKTAIEPFIGLPQTLAHLNSMETAIKSALNKITGVLINNYSYNVVTDSNSAKLGVVKIDYTIVPAYEIREVRNTVTISSTNV